MDNLKSDLQQINKDINQGINEINLHNQKINHIEGKLSNVEEKTKVTGEYLNGFKSFFGFFPKLFSFNKKKQNKENKENKEDKEFKNIPTPPTSKDDIKTEDDLDELEKEILNLNKNAKKIKEGIEISLEATKSLENKITHSSSQADKLNKHAKDIYYKK